jgi:hypothetical protein
VVERKVPIMLPSGKQGIGTDVPIRESTERWSEYTLEDGTVIRAKFSLIAIVRADGEYDAQGQPIYSTNAVPVMGIISVPDHLRKKN